MGHYDEQREAADRELKEQIKRQLENWENCLHNFIPVEVDIRGRATVLKCTKCNKMMIQG